jgi:RimJ/RimL family protein N-acetyltransferase
MENRIVFLDLPKTRVYLRPVEKDDLPFFRQALNNENIAKLLNRHNPITEMEQEDWFENLPKKKEANRQCAIVLKEGDALIGSIGLHNINWIDRTAETGAFIGREDLHGKGLGTEAKMLWLKYAFLTLNLRQISSRAYAFNGRSIGYSLKCGYKEVGRYPKYVFRYGEYHDLVHLMVTREDWEPLWQEFEKKFGTD